VTARENANRSRTPAPIGGAKRSITGPSLSHA